MFLLLEEMVEFPATSILKYMKSWIKITTITTSVILHDFIALFRSNFGLMNQNGSA